MEVLCRAARLASEVDWSKIVVNGGGVVGPDARQLLLWVSGVRIGPVAVGLVILGRNVAPGSAADGGDEPPHERARAVRIACRPARVVKRSGCPPAPVNQEDLWICLYRSPEVRHVHWHRLSSCDARRTDTGGHADIDGGRRKAHWRPGVEVRRGGA